MTVRKQESLFVFLALVAAASFLCASASDLTRTDGLNGRKFLLESAENNEPGRTATFSLKTLATHQEHGHKLWADSGRSLLQWPRPPSPETSKSLELQDGDTSASDLNFHIDYPQPHPNPTPDNHDYPPPGDTSASDLNFHIDYPQPHPNPSPDIHDYPPPGDTNASDLIFHIDYPQPHPNPTPDNHDYPPPASMTFSTNNVNTHTPFHPGRAVVGQPNA